MNLLDRRLVWLHALLVCVERKRHKHKAIVSQPQRLSERLG